MSNYDVKINWDFDSDTKCRLFEKPIIIDISDPQLGTDVNLSFNDTGLCFFEVCSKSTANVYIQNALDNELFLLKNFNKPFLFVRNLGPCHMFVHAADTGISNMFWNFCNSKISGVSSSSCCNYFLNPGEGVFLSICASQDGAKYISKACYPLGFYYEFANVDAVNEDSIYPAILNSNCFPTYSYECISGIDYSPKVFCSTNSNINISSDPFLRKNTSPTGFCSGEWSSYFKEDFNLKISPQSGFASSYLSGTKNSGNILAIKPMFGEDVVCKELCSFYFSSWIKPLCFPSSGSSSVFQLSNVNNNKLFSGLSCTGKFYNLDFDILRIDSLGYPSIGPSIEYVSGKCILNGFLFDGYNNINYCVTGLGKDVLSNYFSASFKIDPIDDIDPSLNQLIIDTDRWKISLLSGRLFYKDLYGYGACSAPLCTGIPSCVFFDKQLCSLVFYTTCFSDVDNDPYAGWNGDTNCGSIPSNIQWVYSNLPYVENFSIGGRSVDLDYQMVTGCKAYGMLTYNYNDPGGYITTGYDSRFDLSTQTHYTVEFFTSLNASATTMGYFKFPGLTLYKDCVQLGNCSAVPATFNSCIGNNQLKHVLVSRESNCFKLFVEGKCVFGTTYTGVTGDVFPAQFGCVNGYGSINGCLTNLRVIKGQGLYNQCSCFAPPILPLTTSGYGVKLQPITGCVSFLGFNSSGLDSGLTHIFLSGYQKIDCCINYTGMLLKTDCCFFPFYGSIFNLKINETYVPSSAVELYSFCCTGIFQAKSNSISTIETNFPTINCSYSFKEAVNYEVKSISGFNLNEWNFYEVRVDQVYSLNNVYDVCMRLNYDDNLITCFQTSNYSNRCLVVSGIPTGISGLRLQENGNLVCDIVEFKINPQVCENQRFNGLIKNLFYYKCESHESIGTIETCVTADFDLKEKDIFKIKSFSFNCTVDSGVDLILNFCKNSGQKINSNIELSSYFGIDSFNFSGIVDSFTVCDFDGKIYSGLGCEMDSFYICDNIKSNKNYSVLYNVCDCGSQKLNNYLYAFSGCAIEKLHQITLNDTALLNQICSTDLDLQPFVTGLNLSGIYALTAEEGCALKVKMDLFPNSSIKDIFNLNVFKSGLYTPPNSIYPYLYCFDLAPVNARSNTGVSGDWISAQDFNSVPLNLFLNYANVIDCNSSSYQENSTGLNCICLSFSENSISTKTIEQKNSLSKSEDFIPIFSDIEESFFYCCLEFKYKPVTSVYFASQYYDIPNSCINLNINVTGRCASINFPMRGFNSRNFKIINDYSLVEKIIDSCALINFNDGFSYLLCCHFSNDICYTYPKLRNTSNISGFSGFSTPSVTIENDHSLLLQKNLQFYLNPFENFENDKFYGLNNFLFFVASKLNGGIGNLNYSGYSYGSSDYNFLMIDLQDEFYSCCFSLPSGTGTFLIDERISFSEYSFENPVPYKTKNATCYNYIMPISTGFNFLDSGKLIRSNLNLINCYNLNGPFNFRQISLNYSGGSTGYCYLTGASGQNTGCLLVMNCDSSYNAYLSKSYLRYSDLDTFETCNYRHVEISKKYTYSGLQPIFICTNYPLLEIKDPLITTSLLSYTGTCSPISGLFYLKYDLNNYQKKSFKFLAPEGTLINCVSWIDDDGFKTICSSAASTDGLIENNTSLINFKATGCISCNNINYDTGNLCIGINLIGGL